MNNMYRVNVALAGDIRQVVVKNGVTVPELVMLRYIHNDSSVTNITLTGKDNYDSDSERDRLGKIYSDEKVDKVFSSYGDLPMDIKKLRINPSLLEPGAEPIGKFPKGKKKIKKQVTEHMQVEEVVDDEPVEAI